MTITDTGPHFAECGTAEPGLREILCVYYRSTFDQEESEFLADRYLQGLGDITKVTVPAGRVH